MSMDLNWPYQNKGKILYSIFQTHHIWKHCKHLKQVNSDSVVMEKTLAITLSIVLQASNEHCLRMLMDLYLPY